MYEVGNTRSKVQAICRNQHKQQGDYAGVSIALLYTDDGIDLHTLNSSQQINE